MTYRSDKQNDDLPLTKQVIEQLDASNEALPQQVTQDIAMARQRALAQARNAKTTGKVKQGNKSWQFPVFAVGTPAAVALIALLLVSYGPNEAIPTLPTELVMGEVSVDDMALINDMEFAQDLEFADWLAQQDQEALL